jgi:ABC-type branched-subunit amino acid transport system substrate-binding protein
VTRLRLLAIASVLVLVVAACGRSGESTKGDNGGNGGQTSDTTASSDEQGLAQGAFGDLGVLCKPAPKGQKAPSTSDPGVTADSIQVSTFSDPGFQGRLGLNQEMFDTAEAFSKWCNDKGGINGRKIVLKERDAKLTEFQQRVIEACDEGDFFSVGGGAVFDDTGQADRLKCGLPIIYGYAVTAVAADADLSIQPVPNPGNEQPIGAMKYIAKTFPDTTQNVGVFTGQLETTKVVAERNKEAMDQLGWKVVYDGAYNPAGEQSWRPFLEPMRNQGVKGLYWVGEPTNLSKFLSEAASLDIKFDWVLADANHYDAQTTSIGTAADGVYVRTAFYPFLDKAQAKKNPATQQYLDLIDQYDPGGKIANLGAQGLSAWLLFAKAANECGADLTRDCVWAKAQAITEWTGGGLHAPQNLKTKKASNCYALLKVEGGKFVLDTGIKPTDGIYNCDKGNVATLTGNYGTGAKCPNAAYADDPKPSNCS